MDKVFAACTAPETGKAETPPLQKDGAGGEVFRVWIITASDKGFRGERKDESGPLTREIVTAAGYTAKGYTLLPDDGEGIEKELRRISDNGLADLILTTGGTGLSPRDRVPEARHAEPGNSRYTKGYAYC